MKTVARIMSMIIVVAMFGYLANTLNELNDKIVRIDIKVQDLLNDIYKRDQEQETNTMLYLEGMYVNQ